MISTWKLNLLITLLTFLLLAGCVEAEQTVPFDASAFEAISSNEEVAVIVAKDRFVQGETVPYSIINRSTKTIYFRARGPACEWPAAVLYTFTGKASDWERVELEALDFTVVETEPDLGKLAPSATVECIWNQTAWQAAELEGVGRFTRKEPGLHRELLPVPLGYYQFGFHYTYDPDIVLSQPAESAIAYSPTFEIEKDP